MSNKNILKVTEKELFRLREQIMEEYLKELDRLGLKSTNDVDYLKDKKNATKLENLNYAFNAYAYSIVAFKKGDYENFFKFYNYSLRFLSRNLTLENITDFMSELGKANAAKRHIETYKLKREAIQYWKDNIDPNISNDAAAEILTKIVPVKFRTLSKYVSEAKKDLHSASKK